MKVRRPIPLLSGPAILLGAAAGWVSLAAEPALASTPPAAMCTRTTCTFTETGSGTYA